MLEESFEKLWKGDQQHVPMLEESFEKLWKDKMGDCEYLGSLVSSMHRRADMIKKDGSMTKY